MLPASVKWSCACCEANLSDALSRELSIEIYRLEQWREKALTGIDESLKKRQSDPVQTELNQTMRRFGELTMENELPYGVQRVCHVWEQARSSFYYAARHVPQAAPKRRGPCRSISDEDLLGGLNEIRLP